MAVSNTSPHAAAPVPEAAAVLRGSNLLVLLSMLVACAASLGLYAYPIATAVPCHDDFQLLLASWTWPATRSHLWSPHNEHVVPLGRLTTWGMVLLGGGHLTAMPRLAALQGPLAVVFGMLLVYLFVRRETGRPFLGLLAMTFFGVSTQYSQAVTWYSASFVLLALDMSLLALLAAQRWRQTGRSGYLLACAAGAALAPTWFGLGVLGGPLCCLYLLPEGGRQWGRAALAALAPLAGTAAYLGVALSRPNTARDVIHAEQYNGSNLIDVFAPLEGLASTARALVDHLLLGTLGIWGVVCPLWLVALGVIGLTAFGAWWWWRAPHRRLVLLGIGFILCSDLVIYSSRAFIGYEHMITWNRYDLLPHLGLTLFLAGGLSLRSGPVLCRRQALAVCLLSVLLFASQLPRGRALTFNCNHPEQLVVLQAIEEVDERCRQLRISGPTAHEALGYLYIPQADLRWGDGFKFVRGSPNPLPRSVEEAQRLLRE